MVRRLVLTVIAAAALWATPSVAQDRAETLADIRQELTVLYVEVQRLKKELSTTGGVSAPVAGSNTLERVDLLEGELVRLTNLTEQLQNRIAMIVADGTNRIGDLEFRLVELEGGDISKLGETTTLGGEAMDDIAAAPADTFDAGGSGDDSDLAVAEQQDFDIALSALNTGNQQDAAVRFTIFTETYPVGPLTGQAHFYRGQALEALGDTTNAARAYLESFSGAPDNPMAADALYHLGLALNQLGQINEACISLTQVAVKYPASPVVTDAEAAATQLGCQ